MLKIDDKYSLIKIQFHDVLHWKVTLKNYETNEIETKIISQYYIDEL